MVSAREIAPLRFRHALQRIQMRPHFLRRQRRGGDGADRVPAIAVPRGAAQRGAGVAADPYRGMRPLQREGFAADVGVAVELAGEAGGRSGPELLEDRDPFVGHRAAPVENGAVQGLEFLLQPADADPQRDPSAGQDIERRHHLRRQHRVAIGQHQHRGDEAQPLRRAGHHAQDGEGFQRVAATGMLAVQGVGIGRLAFHREDDVVGDHGRVQPQALAFTGQGEDALARGGGAAGGEVEAVAHGVSLSLLEMPKSQASVEFFGRPANSQTAVCGATIRDPLWPAACRAGEFWQEQAVQWRA